MLLKALYDLARQHRLFEDVHLQKRGVHLLIPIDANGKLTATALIPLYSKDKRGKDILGRELPMPRFPGENNGGKAYFLADSCAAILGIDKERGEGLTVEGPRLVNPAKSFLHFWERVQAAYDATHLPQINALLLFRKENLPVQDGKIATRLPFLEARPDKNGKSEIGAKTADGGWEPLAQLTLSFQFDGGLLFDGDRAHPLTKYWFEEYRNEAFSEEGEEASVPVDRGLCLVTGEPDVPIARSHKPKILKIPNIGSGGYLVSFAKECPAFSSYGFEMGANAPVSEEAAASYALALQSLLDSENNSIRVGKTVVCFWVREQAKSASRIANLLNRPDPKSVSDFLTSPWAGLDRALAKKDLFLSVTLSGNAGRVVVRHWIQQTVEDAVENIRHWFQDLSIMEFPNRPERVKKRRNSTPSPDGPAPPQKAETPPLAVFRLACATVREAKDLTSETSAQLYRAALERTAPSVMLLKPILHRLDADLHKHGRNTLLNVSRFALLKLILNRNRRETDPMIHCQVFETDDNPYNCGRLMALLSEIQAKAHDFKLEGPGVAERYFGAASASPSSVFPLLLRLNRHHLDKIGKSERYASHRKPLEDALREVLCHFRPNREGDPPQFPRTLELHAQGRFAIGFYQQQAKSAHDRDDAVRAKAAREAAAR